MTWIFWLRLEIGKVPKLFQSHGDLDAIRCLGCVEIDVWGLSRWRHGGK